MSQSGASDSQSDVQRQQGARAGGALLQMLAEGRSYSGRERNCCFLNTGADPRSEGRFATVSAASGLDFIEDGRAIGVLDWDQDGDLDIWMSNRNAPRLRLLRNEANPHNHFVKFRLIGNATTGNRDAVGARVELLIADSANNQLRNIRTLRAGEGFLAQSSKTVHFGIGQAESIQQVIVSWPGQQQTESFSVDGIDATFELVQGSGVARRLEIQRNELTLRPATPQQLQPTVDARIPLQVLLPAPQLKYNSFEGAKKFMPASGRSTLVLFWSASCEICQAELTEMTRRAEEIHAGGINVLALSIDELTGDGTAQAQALLQRLDFPFDSGLANERLMQEIQDMHDHLMPLHRSLPVPASILIDRSGQLSVIYKGKLSIDQLLVDTNHSSGSSLDRFVRSSPLTGRTVDDWLIHDAIVRQEVAARDLYAKKLQRSGATDLALQQFRQVVKLKPDYPYAQHVVGSVLMEQGDFAAARRHYETALQSLPRDVNILTALANVYIRGGNLDKAVSYCQQAVEVDPQAAENRVNLGNVLFQQNRLTEARLQYEKAIDLQPENVKARVNLGAILLREGNVKDAKQQFESVVFYDPKYVPAHLNLGSLYMAENNYEKAKFHLEEALRLEPDNPQSKAEFARLMSLIQSRKNSDSNQ